ncbi:MAG TPA: hypothetical protein VEP89_10185 [Draconibacterium sp.]|nr:hypothetical protein [Draconibacterium sp.]
MKHSIFILFLFIISSSCSTTRKMYDDAFNAALIGQRELDIVATLGRPTRTEQLSEGRKVMVYEYPVKGMFTTPNQSKFTYSSQRDLTGQAGGLTYNSGANTSMNSSQYTIYDKSMAYLKVFIDKDGKSIKFEENLSREQVDMLYKKFKPYVSEEQ